MDRLTGFLVIVVAGLTLVVFAVIFGVDAINDVFKGETTEVATLETSVLEPVIAAPPPVAVPEPTNTKSKVPFPKRNAPLPDELRNVTPTGILPGPQVTAPLVRVPGPPPPKLVDLPPRPARLFLVAVEQAGIVTSKGQRVVFEGVSPTPLDRTCLTEDGGSRPCGQQAATALKRFIRNRAIDCVYAEDEDENDTQDDRRQPAEARCTLGNQDISHWLVAGGWAAAAESAPSAIKELEDKARKAKRGLWR